MRSSTLPPCQTCMQSQSEQECSDCWALMNENETSTDVNIFNSLPWTNYNITFRRRFEGDENSGDLPLTTTAVCGVRSVNSLGRSVWSSVAVAALKHRRKRSYFIIQNYEQVYRFSNLLSSTFPPSTSLYRMTSLDMDTRMDWRFSNEGFDVQHLADAGPLNLVYTDVEALRDNNGTRILCGCYNFIEERWYFGAEEPSTTTTNATQYVIVSGQRNHFYSDQFDYFPFNYNYTVDRLERIAILNGRPLGILCFPAHSLLLWTEFQTEQASYIIQSLRTSNSLLKSPQIRSINGSDNHHLLSPAIFRNGHATFLAILDSGVWILNHKGLATQLLIGQDEMPGFPWENVTTIVSDDVYFCCLISLRPGLYCFNFRSRNLTGIAEIRRVTHPVSAEMLEVPGLQSHLVTNTSLNGLVSIHALGSVFPASFEDCLYPTPNNLQFETSNKETGSLSFSLAWNTSKLCANSSKPLVYVTVYFMQLSESKFSKQEKYCNTLEDCPCDLLEAGNSQCQLGFEPDQPLAIKAGYQIQFEVKRGFEYLILVLVQPQINEQLLSFWRQEQQVPSTMFRGTFRVFPAVYQQISQSNVTALLGTLIPAALLIALAVGVLLWLYRTRWYIYRSLIRIQHKQISRLEQLGEGHFGEVWKATLTYGSHKTAETDRKRLNATYKPIIVAVKMLKDGATELEKREFLEEGILMSKFKHDNIAKAFGICMDSRPVQLVMEYMDGGSLRSYLLRTDVREVLKMKDFYLIAEHLTKACAYLEQQGYIHRDISIRNCLIKTYVQNVGPKIVKLADFGLAKDIGSEDSNMYKPAHQPILPIPYTAPEGIKGSFNSKTDVWSYGVALYEVFSWGATPYGRCSLKPELHPTCPMRVFTLAEIDQWVCMEKKSLMCLPCPCKANFSECTRNIMTQCWEYEPNDRPSFRDLLKILAMSRAEIESYPYFKRPARETRIDYECDSGFASVTGSSTQSNPDPARVVFADAYDPCKRASAIVMEPDLDKEEITRLSSNASATTT